MAEEIRVDRSGVSGASSALTSRGLDIAGNGKNAEQALADAAAAVRSAPLVSAVGALVVKLSGQAGTVGARVDALGSGVGSAALSLMATDDDMASKVRGLVP